MGDEHADRARERLFPWALPAGRDRAARVVLDREQIVDAAIRILDTEGLDALSMRRLGQELGAGATSLYWHIRNKDELLDLVLDRIIGEVAPLLPRGVGWRETSVAAARGLRAVLVRHRAIAPVMGERPTVGPNALGALEVLLTSFVEGGFDDMGGFLAATTIINWAAGFAVFEVRDPLGPGAGPDAQAAFQEELIAFVASLPSDRYPTTLRLLPLGPRLSADVQFEYGLERLLDGVEVDRAARAGATTA